ncbi:DUF1801 domain-containing protein [Flavobacterium aciduliphilum]|uniref:Uncharacterized protein DUF1801 n=1 Tax=Flavobacterium aciduliphilum TaxID=1101402 RepID=A0A328YIM8_9FLAO|nr:DUF1801 domain-containing protein [Flavobacterium aciduliphilum]RAR73911.1 uncharacterized protein DUF1801 [Flavobacterium aciduliphilum]
MAKNKTIVTENSVMDFINSYVADDQKKIDSFELIHLMEKWTGFPAKMWGPSIIGFGSYSYKYASGHEGTAPILAFSPRKAAFSLYVYSPSDENTLLLDELGKYKLAKACIYVKKLSDIQLSTLELVCKATIAYITQHNECACRT